MSRRTSLRTPEDREPPTEASAIERANRVFGRRPVTTIYWSLMNSSWRSRLWEMEQRPMTRTPARSLMIERMVQDRLLEEHEHNARTRRAIEMAHGIMWANRSLPRPRIHVGSAVVAWMKTLCLTEDTRLPPASRLAGFDLIEEPDWEPGRVVVRIDMEVS
jgi:hypothetical protein